eukprot:tig00021221_g19355.t1
MDEGSDRALPAPSPTGEATAASQPELEETEVFEIIDYTLASPWEKCIAQIEEHLAKWGIGSDPDKQVDVAPARPAGTGTAVEELTYGDNQFFIKYFYHTPEEGEGEVGVLREMGCREIDFQDMRHELQRWFGVRNFLFVVPAAAATLDAGEAAGILSALSIALRHMGCALPAFVPHGEAWRKLYRGVAHVSGASSTLHMDVALTDPPSGGYRIPDLVAAFRSKLESCSGRAWAPAAGDSISVSALYTYAKEGADRNAWRAPDLKAVIMRRMEAAPVEWGPEDDPVAGLELGAYWPQVDADVLAALGDGSGEGETEAFNPENAPTWRLRCFPASSVWCRLADSLRALCAVMLDSAKVDDLTDLLTPGAAPSESVFASLASSLYPSGSGTPEDIVRGLLSTLGHDRHGHGPVTSPGAVRVPQLKAAEPSSLLVQLALRMAAQGSARGAVSLWLAFVREVRSRWLALEAALADEEGAGVPPDALQRARVGGVGEGAPDFRHCLLHQKLMMVPAPARPCPAPPRPPLPASASASRASLDRSITPDGFCSPYHQSPSLTSAPSPFTLGGLLNCCMEARWAHHARDHPEEAGSEGWGGGSGDGWDVGEWEDVDGRGEEEEAEEGKEEKGAEEKKEEEEEKEQAEKAGGEGEGEGEGEGAEEKEGDGGEGSEDEFYDAEAEEGGEEGEEAEAEAGPSGEAKEEPAAGAGEGAGGEPRGRLRPMEGVKLLATGEQAHVPITQDAPFLTEDMVKEQEEVFTKLGDTPLASQIRAQMQKAHLLSDMRAFKAANPGCVLEDFVRWHSPRDWSPPADPPEGSGREAKFGRLSARMHRPGNLWRTSWEEATPAAVAEQGALFAAEKEAEKVLQYLEAPQRPAELLFQLVRCAFVGAYDALGRRPGPALPSHEAMMAALSSLLEEVCGPAVAGGAPLPQEACERVCAAFEEVEAHASLALSLSNKLPEDPDIVDRLLAEQQVQLTTAKQRTAARGLFQSGGFASVLTALVRKALGIVAPTRPDSPHAPPTGAILVLFCKAVGIVAPTRPDTFGMLAAWKAPDAREFVLRHEPASDPEGTAGGARLYARLAPDDVRSASVLPSSY